MVHAHEYDYMGCTILWCLHSVARQECSFVPLKNMGRPGYKAS